MKIIKGDFPFNEIRDESGDYFSSKHEAFKAGHKPNQIWSIVEGESAFVYGPAYHLINVIGYIATDESHDGNTYYEEKL